MTKPRSPFPVSRSPNPGLTLIELVVIVIIIAVITAAGLVSFSMIADRRLEAEARKIVSDLSWTRQLAVATHRNYIVDFDPGQDRYIIYRDSIAPGNEIERKNLEVDLVSLAPPPNQLQFNFPSGTTKDKTITLSYQGKTEQIIVFGKTGYVRRQ